MFSHKQIHPLNGFREMKVNVMYNLFKCVCCALYMCVHACVRECLLLNLHSIFVLLLFLDFIRRYFK